LACHEYIIYFFGKKWAFSRNSPRFI